MDIRTKIHNFIKETLVDNDYHEEVKDAESLIMSGIMDSLAIIHIVVFLEQEFNIDFFDIYFDQSQFDSIDLIVDFVETHYT